MTKIEVGKTYQTRDGRTVRILATDLMDLNPVVGAILFKDGIELVAYFAADGSFAGSDAENKLDLIIPPDRKSMWLNWYGPDHSGLYHETREQADECAGNFRTHVLEIITEDGKPVDVKIHEVGK